MSIDTIFQFLRTLFGGLIDKFKLANPALYTSIVTILLTAEGFLLVLLDRDIFKPAIEATLEVVVVIVGGILTVIGANEVARRSERFKNISAKGSTRTWVLTFAVLAAFIASVWLFSKKVPNVPEQATAITPTGESLTLPTPETDPAKPLTSYVVTVLASKTDTVTSISTGGLPSVRVPQRLQYSLVFFPVTMNHVPTIEDFSIVKPRDGYKLERIVNIQLYLNK